MFDACLPFGPCLTSNVTFWFSCNDLKPLLCISEKCAKRSSPPPSGVMKPKPLASLNHLTVPVAMNKSKNLKEPHCQNAISGAPISRQTCLSDVSQFRRPFHRPSDQNKFRRYPIDYATPNPRTIRIFP